MYEGINNPVTIPNDIDLASKGGIIWDKDRDNVRDSRIVDVQSNALLSTSLPNSKLNGSVDISSYITYNSNGWTFLTIVQGKIQTVIVMYLGLSANNQDFLQLKIGLAMDKEIDI